MAAAGDALVAARDAEDDGLVVGDAGGDVERERDAELAVAGARGARGEVGGDELDRAENGELAGAGRRTGGDVGAGVEVAGARGRQRETRIAPRDSART